jgi:cytochrome c2
MLRGAVGAGDLIVEERMIRSRVSMTLATAALITTGGAFAQDAATVEKGKTVYADQKCKMCHAVAGVGNLKGSLDGVGGKLSADEIKQWLQNPKEMAEKTKAARKPPMKSYPTLPAGDRDALVAYLQTLKK